VLRESRWHQSRFRMLLVRNADLALSREGGETVWRPWERQIRGQRCSDRPGGEESKASSVRCAGSGKGNTSEVLLRRAIVGFYHWGDISARKRMELAEISTCCKRGGQQDAEAELFWPISGLTTTGQNGSKRYSGNTSSRTFVVAEVRFHI